MSNVETYRRLNETLTGKRVKCVHMNDEYPVESGEEGTVSCVDDMGTVHVEWDNGRRIGLVPKEDQYVVL